MGVGVRDSKYVVIFNPLQPSRSRDAAHVQCAIWPLTQGKSRPGLIDTGHLQQNISVTILVRKFQQTTYRKPQTAKRMITITDNVM